MTTTLIAKKTPAPVRNGAPVADRAEVAAELAALDAEQADAIATLRHGVNIATDAVRAAQRDRLTALAALDDAETRFDSRRRSLRKALYKSAPLDAIGRLQRRLEAQANEVRDTPDWLSAAAYDARCNRAVLLLAAIKKCQGELPFSVDPAAGIAELEKLLQEK